MGEPLPEFDPEFDTEPAQWAAMYRACGWPVVPAWMPAEQQNFKHPKVTWRHYHAVIPQADHDAWYAENGMHAARPNMGVLTGGPYKLLMIDLDTYKSPKALAWWREVLETENHGIEPETVRQRSGGGGLQLFFKAPADWHCPNAVTDLGVDIRCDGGFAMLPPSLHDSGNSYAWEAGFAPWEVHVDLAGQWLLDAIEALIEAHGHEFRRGADGGASSAPSQTGGELNEWGKFWDLRERVMFRHVLAPGAGMGAGTAGAAASGAFSAGLGAAGAGSLRGLRPQDRACSTRKGTRLGPVPEQVAGRHEAMGLGQDGRGGRAAGAEG